MNKKIVKFSDFYVSFIFSFIISAFVFYYNTVFGILSFIASSIFVFFVFTYVKRKNYEYFNDIKQHRETLDNIASEVVYKMPFPMAVINAHGRIKWNSPEFREICFENEIIGLNIKNVIDNFNINEIVENKNGSFIWKKDTFDYIVNYNVIKDVESGDINIVIYLLNNSEYSNLKELYENSQINLMLIYVDNYEDVVKGVRDELRPIMNANLDSLVIDYFSELGGVVRKYEKGKYLGIIDNKILNILENNKFSILQKIQSVESTGTIKPTLSIGIGMFGDEIFSKYKESQLAVDMALGRGGAQVVCKNGEQLKFFGGRNSTETERSNIKARVISQALRRLILESSEVFVMGHKNPDMDCFGSGLGILSICKNLGKECYLILDDVPVTIKNVYDKVNCKEKHYTEMMISPDRAYDICKETSLVIMVDNSRKLSSEAPNLLDITSKIVVIDHHRRGKDFVSTAMLTYLEPYASSACELVTEIFYYMFDDVKLEKVVAEALLAGIAVDTKNFYYQTSVRTFETASFLKKFGADSLEVKQLFKDNFNTIKLKSNVISNAISYKNFICIGVFDQQIDESMLIAAQSADDLLSVLDIECSFVLTRVNGQIHISGRSLGKVSVQLILEKLGGGGHYTSAGARLDCTMEEAISKLKFAIDEYLKEEVKDEININ